ncbi:MAG TPA: hypothetical protein VGA58_13690 [bacterium]
MGQLTITKKIGLQADVLFEQNSGRVWIFGQSLGPGRLTLKQESPPKDINDGSNVIFPFGTFGDSGEGVHKGTWYAIASLDATVVLCTEASQ